MATPTTRLAASDTAPAHVLHVARRLTYGQTPALREEITSIGSTAWIDRQLAWESIDDRDADAIVATWPRASADPAALSDGSARGAVRRELPTATVARTIWSRRQLHEMLVEFWSNHFNINVHNDRAVRFLPQHDRDVIRPLATARFTDLLLAVAKSPAMLAYLDQAESRVDGGRLPIENYARELLELHTVGVDGGYDETDVKEVAWLLSGWGITSNTTGGFTFRSARHQMGPLAKGGDVLGWKPGRLTGLAAGESLLTFLALHPTTARRLAHKLAIRFIGDTVQRDDAVVRAAADAYLANDTAIAPMVRSILTSDEFRASSGRRFRRPIEFLAATFRATQIQWDASKSDKFRDLVMGRLALLGQPPLSWPTPDGYPDVDEAWLDAGAMSARWNLTSSAADGFGLASPAFDASRILGTAPIATLGDALDRAGIALLGEPLDATSRAAILAAVGRDASTKWSASSSRALLAHVLLTPQFQFR